MSDLQRTIKIVESLAPRLSTLPHLSSLSVEIHGLETGTVENLLRRHGLEYNAHAVEDFWVIAAPALALVFYVKTKPIIDLDDDGSRFPINDRTPDQVLQILWHSLVKEFADADHDVRYNIHLENKISARDLVGLLTLVTNHEIKAYHINDTRWVTIGKDVAIFV